MSRVPGGQPVPGEPGGNHHPAQKIRTPGGRYAWIDTALVPLVRALWAAGFQTVTCCQDLGESIGGHSPRRAAYWKGWVLVELPSADASRLAELAAAHGFGRHWSEPDAWELSMPVVMLGSRAVIPDLVQVHFPAAQLDDLTALLEKERRTPA